MRRGKLIAIGLVLVAMIVTSVIVFLTISKTPVKVSDAVKQSVNFAVALPQSVPKDSYISKEPIYDNAAKAVVTSFKMNKGGDIVISQQKKPNVDLKQVDAQETYLASIGSVYLLKGEAGRLQAIVETKDSWIMVNCSESVGINTCKDIIANLVSY